MKKLTCLILLLLIVLQSGLKAAEPKTKLRNEITAFLVPYQTAASSSSPLKSFDEWIRKITAEGATWKPLAEQLLQNIQTTKSGIISIKSEVYTKPEFATNRSNLLQSHINFLINQHTQEFLALNKHFKISKDAISAADKTLYNDIIAELVPPTDQYIREHKDQLFQNNVEAKIKKILTLPDTSSPKDIAFSFQSALSTALLNLQKIQGYIDLLNAKGTAGLKDEFKEKPKEEEWLVRNVKSNITKLAQYLGFAQVNPTLELLRTQHTQLHIIRDAYISIIEQLLTRTLEEAQKTSIQGQLEQFQSLKEKRDIDQSTILKSKEKALKAIGLK